MSKVTEGPDVPEGTITCNNTLSSTDFVCGNGRGPWNVPNNSINNAALWGYFEGCCEAGTAVSVATYRLTSDMDPAAQACEGDHCGGSTAGWAGIGICPTAALGSGDDNNGIPCGVGGDFADPIVNFSCPSSGLFTYATYDFLGAGANPTYEVHASGVTDCEPQGDDDDDDAVPSTTGIGIMLMALVLLGSSVYFLRRRVTN